MKKIYFLVITALLISNLCKAQLTLTKAANEPVIGDIDFRKSYDSTTLVPRNTGANQVWNFTSLATNTTNIVANTYTTVASISGGTAYPSATIGSTDGTNNTFYKSTATTFELDGIKSGTLSLTFTNTAIIAAWPIAFNYSNTDPIAGTVSAFGLSGSFTGNVITNATGTGTVQLPFGVTLSNCLQVVSTQNVNASFLAGLLTATINLTSYQYYNGSQKFPVLTQNITSILTATAAYNSTTSSITLNNNVFAGIKEYNTSIQDLNIYPNPSTGSFYLTLNNENAETFSVEITNCIGQVVRTFRLENTKGETISNIDINGIDKGIYFIKTVLGNKSGTKKLIVE